MKVTITIPDNIYREMNLTTDKITRIVLKSVPAEKRLELLNIKKNIKSVLSNGKKMSIENVALTAQLAADAGLPFTEEEISMLLSAVDVSGQSADEAFARLGLQILAEPEI